MKTFLQELAEDLFVKQRYETSECVVLLPSLRARAFFNDAITSITQTPVWQPHYTSIDEIMAKASGLQLGDRIKLISVLFKVYEDAFKGDQEKSFNTFDRFYHWGDMLISDFDMIDKYMINANNLLRNITDIKEIEADLSYINVDLQKIIKFWSNVLPDVSLSEQKQRFLKVWEKLPTIYENFRQALKDEGIGYAGMLYRATAKRIQDGENLNLEHKRYIIAGFNALSESEKILFNYLKSEHNAEFYWDYDNYHVDNHGHEAGRFLRPNLKSYAPKSEISHTNFSTTDKQLSVTACVSNISQVKHIINKLPKKGLNKDTAIVLTDESLLEPLLHSLPDTVDGEKLKVNVTMGYPLKNTLAYSFIETLLTLQSHARKDKDSDKPSHFYHKDVTWVLSHPYMKNLCEREANIIANHIRNQHLVSIESTLFNAPIVINNKFTIECPEVLRQVFVKHNDWKSLNSYIISTLNRVAANYANEICEYQAATKDTDVDEHSTQHRLIEEKRHQLEHINKAIDETTKLARSIENCGIAEFSNELYSTILRRHLQSIKIAYDGQPLEGLQVLGILETRCLDFKNVIILSMTDANFPGNHTDQASCIPYGLRLAYHMPTPEDHEAVYAYYFYRLLQRAERVDMLYCSRADDKSTGECSRYIYQLEFESGHTISKHSVGVNVTIEQEQALEVAKDDAVMKSLERFIDNSDASLSPTALFRYVECPLKFYFASIARIRTRNELTDKIDAPTFGNILHKAMEQLYKDFLFTEESGKVGEESKLKPKYNQNEIITKIIEDYDKWEQENKSKKEQNLEQQGNSSIIEKYVDDAIIKLLYDSKNIEPQDFPGDTQLVKDIIIKYIRHGILRHDSKRENAKVMALERVIDYRYEIEDENGKKSIKISGIADRIDELTENTIQLIDYKSGATPHLEFAGIDSLFNGKYQQRISNIFQTLLYSMILSRKCPNMKVKPSLYYASRMLNDKYSPFISIKEQRGAGEVIEDYRVVGEEYETKLTNIFKEMFNKDIPFRQAEDINTCNRCDYRKICKLINEPSY